MHAHVTTYRLSTTEELEEHLSEVAVHEGAVISDQSARTIASWYHSPRSVAITALSHGRPFDTTELANELEHAGLYPDHYVAMRDWLDDLERQLVR